MCPWLLTGSALGPMDCTWIQKFICAEPKQWQFIYCKMEMHVQLGLCPLILANMLAGYPFVKCQMLRGNAIPLTLLPISSALESQKARETQMTFEKGMRLGGATTSTRRGLSILSEQSTIFPFPYKQTIQPSMRRTPAFACTLLITQVSYQRMLQSHLCCSE